MSRRLAALLTCALMAFGQRNRPSAPAPLAAPDPWVVDALALDANGRPVTDLTAADFELVQGGRLRKITNFTWFDTLLLAAARCSLAGRKIRTCGRRAASPSLQSACPRAP